MENTKAKILLVEDIEVSRKAASIWLKKLGCNIEECVTGEQAVKLALKNTYALILMDLTLDDIDGLKVTRMIRAEEGPNRFVPVIALTARVDEETITACFDAGMNDFLSKPFTLENGRAMLSKYLPASYMTSSVKPICASDLSGEF